jgi:hypothetical protein
MRDVGILERSLSDEIVYGRPEHLRVFVSSQMRGGVLAAERAAAIEAIDSHPDYQAWAWERDAAAGPYSAEAVCVRQAASSDALVLLVSDDLTPITVKEFRAAKKAGVPRFVFLKTGASRTARAEALVKRERAGGVTGDFSNPAEVRTQILHALRTYTLRLHRTSIVQAREATRS